MTASNPTGRLQLGFEDDTPWSDVTISECEPPRRLHVLVHDDADSWDLTADLTPDEASTQLRFVMHGIDPASVGEAGPGWEYYLDALLAAMSDSPAPNFDDYLPSQKEFFESQIR